MSKEPINRELREFSDAERKRALEREKVNNNDPCDDWSGLPKSEEATDD